jgi:hypothetical protein
MRMLSVAASLAWLTLVFAGGAGAQNTSPPDKPESSDGRTQTPETKGQKQPQGWTGPTDTGVGGAPASSPQGRNET